MENSTVDTDSVPGDLDLAAELTDDIMAAVEEWADHKRRFESYEGDDVRIEHIEDKLLNAVDRLYALQHLKQSFADIRETVDQAVES